MWYYLLWYCELDTSTVHAFSLVLVSTYGAFGLVLVLTMYPRARGPAGREPGPASRERRARQPTYHEPITMWPERWT